MAIPWYWGRWIFWSLLKETSPAQPSWCPLWYRTLPFPTPPNSQFLEERSLVLYGYSGPSCRQQTQINMLFLPKSTAPICKSLDPKSGCFSSWQAIVFFSLNKRCITSLLLKMIFLPLCSTCPFVVLSLSPSGISPFQFTVHCPRACQPKQILCIVLLVAYVTCLWYLHC